MILDETEKDELMKNHDVSISTDIFQLPGLYTLSQIHQAVDTAEVKKDGPYNVFTNNCSIFITNILSTLNVPLSTHDKQKLQQYAMDRLLNYSTTVRKLSVGVRRLGMNVDSMVARAVSTAIDNL